MEMEKTLNQILDKLDGLEQGQSKLEQGQARLEQRQTKLEQNQEDFKLEAREEFKELKQRATKTEILIENTIIPQLRLLGEGHTIIQRQISKLSVVDAMQDDIATLKMAVKHLSSEVNEIKKAI